MTKTLETTPMVTRAQMLSAMGARSATRRALPTPRLTETETGTSKPIVKRSRSARAARTRGSNGDAPAAHAPAARGS